MCDDVIMTYNVDLTVMLLLALMMSTPSAATSDVVLHMIGPPHLMTSRYVRRHLVRPGERLRLACPVEANPPALVTWYKDGHRVHVGWQRYRVRAEDWALTVRDVQLDDSGVLTCSATNGFGSLDVTYIVYVTLDDRYELPADFDEEFFREIHQKGVAPIFTETQLMRASQHVVAAPGDAVLLRCDAVGRPRVQVQWFKDNKMLQDSRLPGTLHGYRRHGYHHHGDDGFTGEVLGRRSVRHGRDSGAAAAEDDADDDLSLRLDSVTSDDAGQYMCRAFNRAGAVNFTYIVSVVESTDDTVSVLNVTAVVGQSATLVCTVGMTSTSDGRQRRTVQWFRRVDFGSHDAEMTSSGSATSRKTGRYTVLQAGGRTDIRMTSSLAVGGGVQTSKLTLADVVVGDGGVYVCSVSSSGGAVSSARAYLTVRPSADMSYGIRQVSAPADSDVTDDASRHGRVSLTVVCVTTTSCCVITAVVTFFVVLLVTRHRRHHSDVITRHVTSSLITSLLTPPPPPLPDIAKCELSDGVHEHAYDLLDAP